MALYRSLKVDQVDDRAPSGAMGQMYILELFLIGLGGQNRGCDCSYLFSALIVNIRKAKDCWSGAQLRLKSKKSLINPYKTKVCLPFREILFT
jgi:hypothetical protein